MGRRLLIQAAGFLSMLRCTVSAPFYSCVLESIAQRSILRLFRPPGSFQSHWAPSHALSRSGNRVISRWEELSLNQNVV